MKFFKTYIFILIIAFCFCAQNIFAANSSQFPDALKLQPLPAGVHPSNPGNINSNGMNSINNSLLFQQITQYESNQSIYDENTSYVDTTDHILFVADPDNNRVLVFDLNLENVLIDDTPDYVLGQPDFTTSTPGTTQSTLSGPTGIAYDPESEKLFVADTNNNRVMIFDVSSITNGENAIGVLGQPDFTTSTPGTTQSKLDGPYSLDYDPVNKILFVTDGNNNRVVTFDVSSIVNGENAINVLGQPDFTTSTPGTTQSKFSAPAGIAYDSASGKIFVSDINNKRVMVFGASSITNGENAVDTIIPNGDATINPYGNSIIKPRIIARMNSKPKDNSSSVLPKTAHSSSSFFWWIIILIIVIAVAIFLYMRPKNMV